MISDPQVKKLHKQLRKALTLYDAASESGATLVAKRELKKAEQIYKILKEIVGRYPYNG